MTKEIIHYSEEELKRLSDSELLSLVYGLSIRLVDLNQYLIRHIPELKEEIVRRTSFLDIDYKRERNDECIPITARLYCLANELKSTPQCSKEDCHKVVGWNKSKGVFRCYCSGICRSSDTKFKNKVSNTKSTDEFKMKLDHIKKHMSQLMASDEMQTRLRNTNLNKLGYTHPMKSPEIVEKRKQVWIKTLGVDNPFKSKIIQDKCKKTCIETFGVDNVMLSDEFRHNHSEIMKSKEVQDKIKWTCNIRYGCDYYQQSEEYHKNKRHKYYSEKYPGLTFDSTWEVKVYEFCKDNNIEVEYSPAITYKYEYDGRIWTYHPDFLINGKSYEVKGDQFFRMNESTSKEEMFCPYRYDDWSDEYYNWICGKYEAKHQCMLKNNVIILRKI